MKTLDHFQYPARLIEGGIIVASNERYTKGMLAFYEPCEVVVYVERRKKNRSKEQMGYYWGVVLPEIAIHTGHSQEELHKIFKVKYLMQKMIWRGANVFTPRSTSELTTNEFAEYLSTIILEANEMGITVPPADQAYQFTKP